MKLVYAALVAAGVSQAAGCVFTSVEEGQLDVSWNLESGDTCPGGTAEVNIEEVGGGRTYVELFDCVDGRGRTGPIREGRYTVYVNLIDDSGAALYAQSFSADVSITRDGELVPVSFDINVDEAFFALTWSLVDTGGSELSCAEAGAGGVSVLSTLVGPAGSGFDDVFDCEAREGVTSPLPLGDYEVVTSVLETGSDAVLGQSQTRAAALDFGNQLNDLGNFEFVFE